MEKNPELWKNILTENGTETDQMVLQLRLWDIIGNIGDNINEGITEKLLKGPLFKLNGKKENQFGMRIQYENR
ncbi:MAG: hypothetical protein ACRCU6_02900 [Fusobacteriaceae bacterium]